MRLRGSVTSFDAEVGLGEVSGGGHAGDGRSGDGRSGGGVSGGWPFHCTQIADGTRAIEVGAAVDFELRPAHGGRWEAFDLRPAPGGLRPGVDPAGGD